MKPVPLNTAPPTPSESDVDILARTLYGEARGEGLHGMIAVGWAIRNRVDTDLNHDGKPDWWGEGYSGVCHAPYQFSCWNKNDPNYPYLSGQKPIPAKAFTLAIQAAQSVINGRIPDPTGGATHYYAVSMKKPPDWTAHATFTVQIGQHRFYKNVR